MKSESMENIEPQQAIHQKLKDRMFQIEEEWNQMRLKKESTGQSDISDYIIKDVLNTLMKSEFKKLLSHLCVFVKLFKD